MPVGKNKKSNRYDERWVWQKIMKEFVGAKPKMYSSYLIDGNQEQERQRVLREVV